MTLDLITMLMALANQTNGRVTFQDDDGTRFYITDTPYMHDGEVVVPIAEEDDTDSYGDSAS
jgi:hypothetical protein